MIAEYLSPVEVDAMKNIREIYKNDGLSEEDLTKLLEYQEYLDIYLKKNDPEDFFYNSNSQHASLLMSKLFSLTTDKINMVVGRFDGVVSEKGAYCDELKKCLDRDVEVKVLVLDSDVNRTSKALNILLQARKEGKNVRIFHGNEKTKSKLMECFPKYEGNVHFSTFDANKYRLEIVPETYAALASFNAPEDTSKMIGVFDSLIEISGNLK